MRYAFVVLGCAVAACVAPARASENLPEVIVTADPLAAREAHLAAPVAVIDANELRTQSLRNIGDAVSRQLGVNASDFGAHVGQPVIRGLGGGRVRVLEDGIGAMDVATISADHGVAIEPIFAEQIEIFRGPATLLYGSGASGGLVNIVNSRIPRMLAPGMHGELYSHYDSVGDGWLAAFQLEAGIAERLALHVDGLERDSGDIDIPGAVAADPGRGGPRGNLPNSNSETARYGGGATLALDGGHIGFNVAELDSNYGVPGLGDELGVRIDQAQTRYDIEARHRVPLACLDEVRVRWGVSEYAHDEIEPSGAVATHFTNQEWEGRIELTHRPLGPWQGVLGVQLGDRDFAAQGEEAFIAPSALDHQAGFVFEKAHLGRFHLDAGARVEVQGARNDAAGETTHHTLVGLSSGFAFELLPDLLLGVHATRAERAPNLEELFANGPHLATETFEIGDATLAEEVSANIDLFLRKDVGRVRFELNLFHNHIDDFIYLAANDRNGDGMADRVADDFGDSGVILTGGDGLLLVNQAQTQADFRGFEVTAEVTAYTGRMGRLDARAWSDYVDAEFEDDARVPRVPPLRFGFDLDWTRGAAYARLALTRVTAVDAPAALETATGGYTLIDLDVGYTADVAGMGALTLFARGTNLADHEARRHTSFVKDIAPLPGAGALVGLKARF